jgi:hypothetical protein
MDKPTQTEKGVQVYGSCMTLKLLHEFEYKAKLAH